MIFLRTIFGLKHYRWLKINRCRRLGVKYDGVFIFNESRLTLIEKYVYFIKNTRLLRF